jgi:acetoacetyl-CoA synthetase
VSTQPLWQPSPDTIKATNLTAFMAAVERRWGERHDDYASLHAWSVAEPEKFWLSLWDFTGVIAETQGTEVVRDAHKMPGAAWFPEARLNFAENLLRNRDESPALIFRGETGIKRTLSHGALYGLVARLSRALDAAGVKPGDRIAGYLPNIPEAIATMLAAASLGAIWSSCSPDFGIQGVIDRFGQIEPKILFATDRYFYNGKSIDCLPNVTAVADRLPTVTQVILLPYDVETPFPDGTGPGQGLDDFIALHPAEDMEFQSFPFNTPLYILFSSGTTGVPKCIVHGAGGTLLQHLKEHVLHTDVRQHDRVFYFSTLGWMMWNWLVSGLAAGATILLYDGSPFHPDGDTLFTFADEEAMTHFGTSAKFIDAVKKAQLRPRDHHQFAALRSMMSTGSPLAAESFDFVYADVKSDLCLASISGGTDIVACFVGSNPIGPVWRGEIQAPILAMDMSVFDADGKPVSGEKGELVCRRPFPSMPLGFWADDDGAKYRAAYFERFPGVWCHGDWAEITEHGGFIIHGRSDATLNPGGVRIGTAEIYRQVEQIDTVEEALAIGQDWDGDVRIVLFVRLRAGEALDDALIAEIKSRVRTGATPRHVPAVVLQVADIPRTKSGKITELAVRDIIHGHPVKNVEALANPDALDYFRDRAELLE